MTTFLQLIFLLAIILAAAKTAGYLCLRYLRQPSVLGELLVGVILGPSLINLTHLNLFPAGLDETIYELAELGVLLLMFLAGLELNLSEMARSGRVAMLAGSMGVIVPVGLGISTGLLFDFSMERAVFLGLALGATSVSISAQTLMELKVLRTRVGLGLLGSAVFDDVLVILLLSIILALGTGSGGLASVVWVFVRMLVFLAFSASFGLYIIPRLARRVGRLPISQGTLTLAVVVMLVFAITAELVGGMAAITGAFLAGLMYARTAERETVERGISALAYGFFVPIFFVDIGLQVNLRSFPAESFWLVIVVIVIAILGKLLGAGLGARMAGFGWLESIQLGAGMVSRGEVGLILASIGLSQGVLLPTDFSAVVAMVLVTTLITPLLLRALFKKSANKRYTPETKPAIQEEA